MRRIVIVLFCLVALTLGVTACKDDVNPCDEYQRFADTVTDLCPGLSWDCESSYSTLLPEAQQDLDWCLDCVRLRESGESDRDCSEAPISASDCGALLDTTLDASCFAGT